MVSGIIELLAEAPVFVAQVFCFVKLRVILDTLNIFVRSVIFITFVLRDPKQAIYAFSIAQVGSTVTFVIGYYGYFIYKLHRAEQIKGVVKRASDANSDTDTNTRTDGHQTPETDESIPFNSIKQMLPFYLHNQVSIFYPLLCMIILAFCLLISS